jgi:tyrosyl-tRNA synthetase
MTLLEDLDYRGLVYQVTDREGLAERLAQTEPITLYAGFDPTADSLTIGNLAAVLVLRRFQLAGHVPIALVGGATGLIGDPGGKKEERSLNARETVEEWADKIKKQLEPFLDFDGSNKAQLVNNFDWLGEMPAIDLLRDVGKHFPVPYMLAKDSVASRLETGISYTEFSYMILQSYDFLKLHELKGCELQIGGSDQWGNITAGSDLVRRAQGAKTYGLTYPLITTADGTKLGKTEAGTVWLDAERTSPYEFYQYWVNTDDASVLSLLKVFTFLEQEAIQALEEATQQDPGKRQAQHALASELTTLVHGEESTRKAVKISQALFYGTLGELAVDEIELGFGDVPTYTLDKPEAPTLVDLLVNGGISSSKRQARQDIDSGAIYINGERCTEGGRAMRTADGLHGKYLVIRRGKSKYYLVK